MEQTAHRNLRSWSQQQSIDLKDVTATMIFDLTAKKLISYDPSKLSEDLRENFVAFIQGLLSFPLNIPGTAYHKCLQGRKKAMKILKAMMKERRAATDRRNEDFFDFVLEELKKERTILMEAIALDLMFVLLFASFQTTSLAITYCVKHLTDNPLVLKRLTHRLTLGYELNFHQEHEAILRNKENPDSGLTWKEYKSMNFTCQAINETVRLANLVPGLPPGLVFTLGVIRSHWLSGNDLGAPIKLRTES